MCSLFSPIHKKNKYSDLSKTQSRYGRRASDVMKSQKTLLDKNMAFFHS